MLRNLVPIVGVAVLSGCSGLTSENKCTLILIPAIAVSVRDASSGAAASANATIVVAMHGGNADTISAETVHIVAMIEPQK